MYLFKQDFVSFGRGFNLNLCRCDVAFYQHRVLRQSFSDSSMHMFFELHMCGNIHIYIYLWFLFVLTCLIFFLCTCIGKLPFSSMSITCLSHVVYFLYVKLFCHARVFHSNWASFVWVTIALHSRVQVGPSASLRHGVFIIIYNMCSIMWVRDSVYFALWCSNLWLLYIHENMHRIKKFIAAYHVPRRISCM